MIEYIKSLLPRLKEYSRQLDDNTLLAEHPWIVINEDGQKITHVFRRNNELLVSIKGDVVKGTWEYLPAMNALLIEYSGKSWLYNQGFVDPGVLVLQKDGTEELFVLANQNLVPNLDVKAYLTIQASRVSKQVEAYEAKSKPAKIEYIDIRLRGSDRHVKIHVNGGYIYNLGNLVYDEDGNRLPDGKYQTFDYYTLHVKDGKLTDFSSPALLVIIVMALALISIVIYFIRSA